jgi:hypothetical protein
VLIVQGTILLIYATNIAMRSILGQAAEDVTETPG